MNLKGLQPKTIDAYAYAYAYVCASASRCIGAYFDYQLDELSEYQLVDYFFDLLASHSWSAVKLDLYSFKFNYTYVLHKPLAMINLIKPPKTERLPDIVTVEEA